MGLHENPRNLGFRDQPDNEIRLLVRRQVGAWRIAPPPGLPTLEEPARRRLGLFYAAAVSCQSLIVAGAVMALAAYHLGPLG